jgi:hypothetical protein
MNIGPTISFSDRLSWREFDTEMWRLYFGLVKGFLTVVASLLFIIVLPAFFLIQNLTFFTAKFVGWVLEWNPQKPGAFRATRIDVDVD